MILSKPGLSWPLGAGAETHRVPGASARLAPAEGLEWAHHQLDFREKNCFETPHLQMTSVCCLCRFEFVYNYLYLANLRANWDEVKRQAEKAPQPEARRYVLPLNIDKVPAGTSVCTIPAVCGRVLQVLCQVAFNSN